MDKGAGDRQSGSIREEAEPPGQAPAWFRDALGVPHESRRVRVGGCSIHYLLWDGQGAAGRPGILLVHGTGAHARWWAHVAPFLADGFAVAAIDLSGMGDSESREHYSIRLFGEEVLAVLRDAGFSIPGRPAPILIGHSFGAFVSAAAAKDWPDDIGGLIVLDAHLAVPEGERDETQRPFVVPRRVYDDFDAALTRFRLVPPQPNTCPFVVDYVARHSLRREGAGWTWKFDGAQLAEENVGSRIFTETAGILPEVRLPAAVLYGQHSTLVSRSIAAYTAARFPMPVPVVEIPGAHHHVMLDQPLSLVAALRAVVACWIAEAGSSGRP